MLVEKLTEVEVLFPEDLTEDIMEEVCAVILHKTNSCKDRDCETCCFNDHEMFTKMVGIINGSL